MTPFLAAVAVYAAIGCVLCLLLRALPVTDDDRPFEGRHVLAVVVAWPILVAWAMYRAEFDRRKQKT